MFLTLDKAQEYSNIILDISEEKSELEESYFKVRNEYLQTQLKMDEAVSRCDHATELLHILEYKK